MKQTFQDSGSARLYLWVAKAKTTMCLFFATLVLGYLLFGFLGCDPAPTLGLVTAIQMLFACLFIGILQQAFLPANQLTKLRCALWTGSTIVLLLLCNLVFGWFDGFPAWSLILLLLLLVFGTIAMALTYFLDLHRETTALNKKLLEFQQTQ